MSKRLSFDAMERIDAMVERIARKAGFTGRENMTYEELLQQKFEEQYGRMLMVKDFTEEIKTYLQDGLLDLMEEGYSEQEAINIIMDKFDEAELSDTFAEFAGAFEEFGVKDNKNRLKKSQLEDAMGILIGSLATLGMGLGLLAGHFAGHIWLGLFVGLFTGAGIGLLVMAVAAMRD